ncbi:MAG: glycosyltransferase family 39 protein [Candidatus Levybacteria bacterium]|nr:glycosyltransferase family 39 protein [Candidatus Levybacteria bacterium]
MKRVEVLIVIFVLLLSLLLRLHNYDIYPQRGASSDEYTYSFLGVSLITQHVPISWSYFSAYKNKYELIIDKLYFPIVSPYFDHPPLNGLLVGGWSMLFGYDTFYKIELRVIRLVPIILSMISSILVFLLGRYLYGYKTGLWALLIYGTTTIFVMNGRVVFAENLLTPLILGSVYLFLRWNKKISNKRALILGTICGLAFWTKEVGVVLYVSLLYIFITEKTKLPRILLLSGLFFLFFGAYLFYGWYYDWEVFKQIMESQASRVVGPETLHLLISKPIIVNKIYNDGWYFLGFLTFFFSFLDYKKHKLILVPVAAYFMILIFSLTKEGEMGWYMIPMFPFMALFTAYFLVESLKTKNWFIFVLLTFVGLAQIKFLYEDNFGLTTTQFRVLVFLLFGPLLITLLLHKDKLFNYIGNFWFYLFIAANIFLTYTYIHPA